MHAPAQKPFPSLPPWTVESRTELARSRIVTFTTRHCRSRQNPQRHGDFTVLEAADWVNTIALTPEQNVVLVEQYRYGTDEMTLEIPGGIVDPGESPEHAAQRELLEETGYRGVSRGIIGRVSANPAIQNNRLHTALIENARTTQVQHTDEHEEIAVHLVPLADIPGLIRRGTIHHSLVVAAFHHLTLLA